VGGAAKAPGQAVAVDQRFGGADDERGITERWWRLTVDELGHVTSCEPVEAIGANGLGVIYVLAFDRKGAQKAAFNEYCNIRNKLRRARYDQEGKCDCGRMRDIEGKRKCTVCIAMRRRSKERAQAKARGEDVEQLDRVETYRKRRETEGAVLRRVVLEEVWQRWLKAPESFTAWLAAEIGVEAKRVG
jgi:hypothetical protein